MEGQLEQKIEDLGNKIIKTKYVKRTNHIIAGFTSGSGHTCNDSPDYIDVPVYGYRYEYSWKNRREAKKELGRIYRESMNEEIRKLILDKFNAAETMRKEHLSAIKDKSINFMIGGLIFGGVPALVYLALNKGCRVS